MKFEELSKINVNDKTESKNGLTYLSWTWAWSEFKKQCPEADYEIYKQENGLPYVFDEDTGYMVFTKATDGKEWKEMWLPVMDGNNKAMLNHPYNYKVKEYADGKWTGGYTEKSVEKATMFDVNKTIMRCLVKNLAMFGLGIYIYAGEDLPEGYEMTKEEAEKMVVTFGKYKGQTLKEVKEVNYNYLYYLIENASSESLKQACSMLVEVLTEEEANEKMILMNELAEIMREKDIPREKLYKKFNVNSDVELTIEQLKKAIKLLNK